ncbi:MAG: VCBS repeat-containing protein [bacterium]
MAIRAAALGDVDGDGTVDLVLSAPASTGAYLSQGDGTFTLTNSGIPLNVLADGLSLGDVNRDGTLDVLLLAGAATRVQTYVAGRFNTQPLADFALQSVVDARKALFADVNGDQVLDLITIGAAGFPPPAGHRRAVPAAVASTPSSPSASPSWTQIATAASTSSRAMATRPASSSAMEQFSSMISWAWRGSPVTWA